jgi:hypothetical protein
MLWLPLELQSLYHEALVGFGKTELASPIVSDYYVQGA